MRTLLTRTMLMPGATPDHRAQHAAPECPPRHAKRPRSREAPTPSDASATSAPRPTSNTRGASDETGPIRIGAWDE